jgi:aromatic-amino-acid transaminase
MCRNYYSSPPNFGAQVVAAVLNDEALKASWLAEVEEMRTRILAMRQELVKVLSTEMPERNFDYLVDASYQQAVNLLPEEKRKLLVQL